MLDFFVASSIIIIAATLTGIPLFMSMLIVLFFGVAWYLIGDE